MVAHNFTLAVLEILAEKALPREELCLAVADLQSSYINFMNFDECLAYYTIRQLLKRILPPSLILPVNDMFTIFN